MNSFCTSGLLTRLCFLAQSSRVSQALPSLLPMALFKVLSSQAKASTRPRASFLREARSSSLAAKANLMASEVKIPASKQLPEYSRILFIPQRQSSFKRQCLRDSFLTSRTLSMKLLKIQQQMKACEASTSDRPEQQSQDSLGVSPSPMPSISFFAAATPRKYELFMKALRRNSGQWNSCTLFISTARLGFLEASLRCSRISTTGLPLLMLSRPFVMNLAVWRCRMVFSPSYVMVGASSVWIRGMPEQLEKPCPPAAFLITSNAFIVSVVKTAFNPLDKACVGLSLENSFLSCASVKTSLPKAANFLDPNRSAQVSAMQGITLSCWSWQSRIWISCPASFLNCFLTREYLVMMVTAIESPQKQLLGIPALMISMVAQEILSLPLLSQSPFLCTLVYLLSMLSLGILMLSIFRQPLSLALQPNFGPISPTSIPGSGLCVSISLMLTIKAWGPYFLSLMISWAITQAWLAYIPRSPIHHLIALSEGVFITKVSVSGSYVAVVSMFWTSEP